MDPLTLALIASLIGLVGTGAGIWASSDNLDKTIEADKDLLEQKNQFTEEMWNKTNEYNSPVNMMQRGMQAGINPNAIAQGISGAPASGAASQVSSSNEGNLPMSNVGELLSSGVFNSVGLGTDSLLKAAEINNINQDTKQKKFATANDAIDFYNRQRYYDILFRKFDDEHYISEQNLEIFRSDAAFRDILNFGQLSDYVAKWDLAKKQLKVYDQEILESKSRVKVNNSQVDVNNAVAANVAEDTKLKTEQIELTKKEKEYYRSTTEYQDKVNKIFTDVGIDPRTDPLVAHYLTLDDDGKETFDKDLHTLNYMQYSGKAAADYDFDGTDIYSIGRLADVLNYGFTNGRHGYAPGRSRYNHINQ